MFSPDAQYFHSIPTAPGVYLMKAAGGKVVYVGKAKNLRERVRQYFRVGGDERFFVVSGLLRRDLKTIDTVVVNNEKEALLLENHLIKEHQPKFNVNLRDDKQYLVLRIDTKKKYSRVEAVRNIKKDGARYFGPYHSASSARETMRTINKHLQLRTCTDHVLKTRKRVCLQYQIGRCCGPCVYPIAEADYAREVDDVSDFLKGNRQQLARSLEARMRSLADEEQFERAARVRDSLAALSRVLDKQTVVQNQLVDQDVFSFHRRGADIYLVALFVRSGKLMGRRHIRHQNAEFEDVEVMQDFIQRHYDSGAFVPTELILPHAIDETIGTWLSELRGSKVSLTVPQRGTKVKLLDMAKQNAESIANTHIATEAELDAKLTHIKKRLGLSRLPRHIECYDIAHVQGSDPVASRVVFVDGVPKKDLYRRYKIKTSTNDDYASMYEVITRRVTRALDEGDENGVWALPDLMVIDGGKGQLKSAHTAMTDLGLDASALDMPDLIALAKERDRQNGNVPERVFKLNAKDANTLRKNSHELHLLTRIRDEAHRFANTFHRKKRRKRNLTSALDNIEGVGSVRRRALLKHFGSVAKIKLATIEDIAAVPGIPAKIAARLHERLNEKAEKK